VHTAHTGWQQLATHNLVDERKLTLHHTPTGLGLENTPLHFSQTQLQHFILKNDNTLQSKSATSSHHYKNSETQVQYSAVQTELVIWDNIWLTESI